MFDNFSEDAKFKQNVAEFLYQQNENALYLLSKTNKKHIELCLSKREIRDKIENNLSNDNLLLFEKYSELTSEINAIEQYHLYLQGVLDCIKTPKIIESVSYDDIIS